MTTLRMLAVAINKSRMGYVFLVGNQLKEWRSMTKPTKSQSETAGALQDLINKFKPDVVVVQKTNPDTGRLSFVETLRQALTRTAAQNYVLDVNVERTQEYANKYEEAHALGGMYPDIKPEVPPKRRYFDHERHRMILFDALALAHTVLQRPSQRLAAAMA